MRTSTSSSPPSTPCSAEDARSTHPRGPDARAEVLPSSDRRCSPARRGRPSPARHAVRRERAAAGFVEHHRSEDRESIFHDGDLPQESFRLVAENPHSDFVWGSTVFRNPEIIWHTRADRLHNTNHGAMLLVTIFRIDYWIMRIDQSIPSKKAGMSPTS